MDMDTDTDTGRCAGDISAQHDLTRPGHGPHADA